MGTYKVNLRGGFSDRTGLKKVNTKIQLSDLDNRTRICILNTINEIYNNHFGNEYYTQSYHCKEFWDNLLSDVYLQIIDISSNAYLTETVLNIVSNTIINDDYYDVLTLVEYIINQFIGFFPFNKEKIIESINNTFEKEYVGYRFIGNVISPITDDIEIKEIENTISNGIDKVSTHITKALVLLSNREKPDYENSIKESITAVETMCNVITGEKDTLGAALKRLESKGIIIHKSLKKAFSELYGYTSDSNGIRHAGELDGPNATFEEAKYMVVSCSAFINYLKGQMAKI